jgi:hypothetical protein
LKPAFLILVTILMTGCMPQVPQMKSNMANGSAFADAATTSRIFGQIKIASNDPVVKALADQGIQTASAATSEVLATQKQLEADAAALRKSQAETEAAKSNKSFVASLQWLAILGLLGLAGSIAATYYGVSWAKGIGVAGIVLIIGGIGLSLVIVPLAKILVWVLAAAAIIALGDLVFLLVKVHGNFAELWKSNQLAVEPTAYTPSTASTIKSITGVIVPVLPASVAGAA